MTSNEFFGNNKQTGLSLVELMITMLIGMVLILGLVTVFSSNRTTNILHAEQSDMDANARAALYTLRQAISHAGYPSANYVILERPFLTPQDAADYQASNPTCPLSGAFITSTFIKSNTVLTTNTTDDFNHGDVITPVFMIDNPDTRPSYRGCLGMSDENARDCNVETMPDPTQAKMVNRFYINDDRSLLCADPRQPMAQPIAENIANMQVLYGVDTLTGMNYMTATEITALENAGNFVWKNVTSVQIALLVRSERDILTEKKRRTYTLLDEKIETPNDKRLYKVYTTTINLENRLFRQLGT